MRPIRNMPLAIKTLAASAVLLVSLVLLGGVGVFSLDRITARLETVVDTALIKQRIKEDLADLAREAHLKLFRYTAWASNGVDSELIAELRTEILEENADIVSRLAQFASRGDLTEREAEQAERLTAAWEKYVAAARDTVDVGSVDPAMATMMLGGSDDDFQAASRHLQELTRAARAQTRSLVESLREEAAHDGHIIQLGGVIAIVLSFATALTFARSIVLPIRSVTEAMREISFGNLNFEANRMSRDRADEIGQMVAAIEMFCRRMRYDKRLIERREQELLTQNARFNAALSNMSQGLAMFDADHRLIVCNDRYAEVYGMPSDLVRPGTSQKRILEFHASSGKYGQIDPDSFMRSRIQIADRGVASERLVELADGRVIAISHRPMPEGGWVSTHDDITERRRVEAKIAFMATHDSLTELPNRVLFRQRLDEALDGVAPPHLVAVHCLDLDHFKGVNDTLGHPIGDLLLQRVARRLGECVGPSDTVSRLSGDEFAIVQTDLEDRRAAADLATRIIAELGKPFDLDGHHVAVGTSVGIAVAEAGSAPPAEQLLRNADTALYRAKSDGRSAYRFFEPGMDATLHARRRLEIDLRHALAEGQFEVHFQPIICTTSGAITAFEALLRWHHPERGAVSPAEFVPVAEDIGLIQQIGTWVLRQACLEAANWPDDVRVAVNLSPVQVGNQELVSIVASALAEAELPPSRLELEVTESVLLLENPTTISLLHSLRDLGVRVAMDDFGTGYSSLSYLRSFPFDKIKIDRCFIKELPGEPDSGAIVRAMIELAECLGMTTTAEGVETAEQLDYLKAQRCAEAQGFHFSHAVPAREIAPLLARWKRRDAA